MAPYSSSPAAAAAAGNPPCTLSPPSLPQQCRPFPWACSAPLARTLSTLRCSISSPAISTSPPLVVKKKRKRYRKLYPGESEGITEEMRFVAMRLRNIKGKYSHKLNRSSAGSGDGSDGETGHWATDDDGGGGGVESEAGGGDEDGEAWSPSIEGVVKYLVDSKLVFDTIERIVDESSDVAYAYFRKTGLERSGSLSKDLEWFSLQDISIPEPSNPGVTYSKYLEELAEKSAPLFLSHFYNIYFSHIAGGQVIVNQSGLLRLLRYLRKCWKEGNWSSADGKGTFWVRSKA
ncbi:probable inactive heme oxygenase 2, chloroplastic isoform X2 [Punica granatum]|uniref:Probable inactive heme oxygenase 2, chloroplastic isoform X2 n=1 Tax=Punica granatum TaxID=22663 RepID=A0A6P8CW51_PUNGR|nr:probable inactive heme oxygenase 2, chloroplastic isoform X2 [Punica granatum]